MQEFGVGERVKVSTSGGEFVGVVMPRPDIVVGDDLILKLDSGYNLGIRRSEIRGVLVIPDKKAEKVGRAPVTAPHSGKPVVSILSTGGTISSKIDYRSGGVSAAFTAEDLLASLPELADFANIRARAVMNVMSEDMTPDLWVKIAEEVYKELSLGAAGVVVTHGTDTLHYSAAALSFLLPNCLKPVILTGSQRSTDRGSSDASLNLLCSVIAAASDLAGVYVVMHASMEDNDCLIHNGTRVRKMHTSRRDAFKSINAEPVARVTPNGKITLLTNEYRKRGEGRLELDTEINPHAALIKVYPGMPSSIVDYYLTKGVKGIVLEGTALGHVPTNTKDPLVPTIEKALKAGVVVCMTTQCLFGRVHPLVYSNLRELSSRGVVFCEDMLPETAYVKLMWVLGHTKDTKKAAEMMIKNYAGEVSHRTVPSGDFIL
jgi:glutamyl-tRNA(Gln) amidotransferase subunit D